MNCIFCCVFNQEKYVDMFFLFLESILIHNVDNTNILVYTSTEFMNKIKQSHLFNNEKIKFEINDTYDNIDKACKARLDLFNLSSIINYNKILYLDTDILVKDDINKVFDVCKEDILYVLEEGEINSDRDFWGKSLFGNEINNYNDKTAFSSGILLFNNCQKIKDLFIKINEDIINRPYNFECYDQPYIIYNAFKYNLYNNKILKSLAVNNDNNIHSDKVIHHFPGYPGRYGHKIEAMTIFLNNIKKLIITIPKILFQTNKISNDTYVLNMIKDKLGSEWKYEFYNDENVIDFFINNPITDLPNIIQKYNSFKKGAHKADLFRYYYLYINGGFFMDSDAMLYIDINSIVKNYNFISVNSSCHPGTIFQGILGASQKNKIIKNALYKAYNTEPTILDNHYHYFCEQLYNIIKENNYGYNIKLYEERRVNHDTGDEILDGDTLLFKHYWKHKIIPHMNITNWNNYNKSELNNFDYSILNTYATPFSLVRVGPNKDGGYIIANGLNYDLFISCGIANDINFEESFLDIHKIKCIAFDGTITSFPTHKNNMEWIQKNIGFSNTEKTTNLKEYIQNNNKIFLKMDIEGSEFNWLDSMLETELEKFSQIVLEVHWPFDIYRCNMLKKLNKTHYIIHIHGNNYCDRDIPKHLPSGRTFDGTVAINNNIMPEIKLPEVFEVTYINKKLCDNSLIKMKEIQFPTILDYPNNPYATDIYFSIPIHSKFTKIKDILGNSNMKFTYNIIK
jgi:mannosyltransferase OCH1-like enzyme